MPQVKGSPAYQEDLKKDAMACVVRFGPPTYFITVTANPAWEEIRTLATKSGGDRENPSQLVIARIFKLKLKKLMERIKRWDGGCKYFF